MLAEDSAAYNEKIQNYCKSARQSYLDQKARAEAGEDILQEEDVDPFKKLPITFESYIAKHRPAHPSS